MLIKVLKNPVNLLSMLGVSLLVFDLQYYMMANLPGTQDRMCVMGAGLTRVNLVFAGLIAVMSGLMVSGLIELFRKKSKKLAASTLSGLALIVATLTVFCAACTLPFITLFGFSLGLSFIGDYDLAIKIASLILMIMALVLVEKRLRKG
ncbi:MAG: hypothetical protein AAB373_06230 [Patescibacteria group bacterium]